MISADRVLVDTSVWIDHLGPGDPLMSTLLVERRVLMHPFVLGEIALGSLRNRTKLIADLRTIPQAVHVDDLDVIHAIERQQMHGSGIGYVDAHLACAALVMSGVVLWTREKKLRKVAERLGIAARLTH